MTICQKKNSGENFSRLVKPAFYITRGTLSGKNCTSLSSYQVFHSISEFYRSLSAKFLDFGRNLHSTCPDDHFGKRIERIIKFTNSFHLFSEIFLSFWGMLSGRVVKTAFHLSRETFGGNFFAKPFTYLIFFSDSERKFFSMIVKAAFYVSRRTFWG